MKPSSTKLLGQESAADKSGGEQSRGKPGPARFAYCTRYRHFAPVANAENSRRICGSRTVGAMGPIRAAAGQSGPVACGAIFKMKVTTQP